MHALAGARVDELQFPGVEALAGQTLFRAPAVYLVAQQRVVDVGHVHAYLVGASGLQAAAHVRPAVIPGDHLPVRDGAAPAGHDGHALAVGRVPGYGRVHGAGVLPQRAVHDALIHARKASVCQLGAERQVGEVVLGRYDKAGGVLVYTVHDARTPLPADAGEGVAAVEHQRVDQRAVRMARCGVHDHAARLIYHDDVRVLVHHVQRYILRGQLGLGRVRQRHGVHIAANGFAVLLHGLPAERHRSGREQALGLGTGQTVHKTREESVDTLAALLCPDIYDFAHLSENSASISSSVNSYSPFFGLAGSLALGAAGWLLAAGAVSAARGAALWAGRG